MSTNSCKNLWIYFISAGVGLFIVQSVCESEFPDNKATCQSLDTDSVLANQIEEKSATYILIHNIIFHAAALVVTPLVGHINDRSDLILFDL